ncbi:MAG TPA: Crp/Fnr family transcriptional regulator [Acidimicrobiia bacterium]
MATHLLDSLADDDRRTVLAATRRRRFGRGEIVFHDGDPGDTLHMIAKGHFAIRITTPLGDVATLRVLGPGEHFGELAVLEPGPRRGSVVALEGGETMSLHRDEFASLRTTIPLLDQVLTAALVSEVRRQAAALVDALYVPVEQRVWRRLAELVELYGSDPPVVIALTQDDLAQLAGTTRPTANRVLRSGEDQGVVNLARGRIEVHDLAALARLGR